MNLVNNPEDRFSHNKATCWMKATAHNACTLVRLHYHRLGIELFVAMGKPLSAIHICQSMIYLKNF